MPVRTIWSLYRPIRRNKFGSAFYWNFLQLRCHFVHNPCTKNTAANGARCSTLARPDFVYILYISTNKALEQTETILTKTNFRNVWNYDTKLYVAPKGLQGAAAYSAATAVKAYVFDNVCMLRTMLTMGIYMVRLLPPNIPKSAIICTNIVSTFWKHSQHLLGMTFKTKCEVISKSSDRKLVLIPTNLSKKKFVVELETSWPVFQSSLIF